MNWLIVSSLCIMFFPARTTSDASSFPARQDDLETSVSMMTKIGSSGSPSFSPDGKRIVFVSNLSGSPQVWIVPVEGGWPELVTANDDPVWDVSWSPTGEWLAVTLAPGGGMNHQVYLVRPDGTDPRLLTFGGKDNNIFGVWARDGRKLTIASNRRDPSTMDAYLADIEKGSLELIFQNQGFGGFADVSRDNKLAILDRMLSAGDNNLYLVDLVTRKEILLTPHEGPGSFAGLLSRDGKYVYLSTDSERDLSAFGRIRIDRDDKPGTIEIIAERKDAELANFRLNEQGTLAVLVWNCEGRHELSFLDLASLQQTLAPKLPAEMVGETLSFSLDGNLLAMVLSGAGSPPNIWVLNVNSGKVHQVTRTPHAGVNLDKLIRPDLVHFKAHDELTLSGWLYRPRGAIAPGPLVLSFHGGPLFQELPSFNSLYQALLSQGIAVFAPNVRGSTGFGKKFANLDNGKLRVNAIRDIKSCVDYVVNAGVANPKQIGIMGRSYGGYMVMAGLTEYPELFAAGADAYGIVNFETFFVHSEPWLAAISRVEYGDPATEREMLKMLSPIHKIDRVVAPTLVLHGANDTNVPVEETTQVVENLKRRNVPVDLVLFPDEGHGFTRTPNRIRSNVSIVRWFVSHLKKEAIKPIGASEIPRERGNL